MHLYEHGAPFNYVTREKTHELHDLYLELGEKRQRVKMPSRMQMATVVLDIGYEQTQEAMKPLMECWDISGCTLITDGCTDRKFRPVMNFIAAGESGAVMLKVVGMSKRKKNAVSLAKLWEGVIREIGVHRVNALCTDNAEVNKHAARILRRRTDVNISRIPWVLCAAHCLNLLLKGICEESWVRELHKRGKTIVNCIKNHHKTAQLFKDCSEMERSRTLTMPTEVRFASVYMMLERLLDRKKVLKAMMEEGWLDIKWAAMKKREIAQTVYLTVRSEEWWEEVEAAVDMMTPVYDLLRQMDKSGTAPYQLWGFEEALVKKMRNIAGITAERQEAIAKKHQIGGAAMERATTSCSSTATPCERNWSTLDLVHEKRRNQLSSETINKLVYVHWNLQLLKIKKKKQVGFIDMWANFFDADAPPPLADPDIVADDGEMSAEEVARRLRLRKTSSARVLKVGKVDESSDTDNSDDGEDLVWRGKGKKRKDVECLDGACHGKGKAQVEEVDDDGDSHEEDEVDEIVTAEFALRTPSESDEDSDDDPSEDDMTLRQDAGQMDSDLQFLLPRTCDSRNATQTEDEAARAHAQALAKRDHAIVMQRVEEDAARRVAIPRRNVERGGEGVDVVPALTASGPSTAVGEATARSMHQQVWKK
ncbi:hypothetical protein CBR_g40340 [Chara braunii]|uniref:DUF659 domain-containing protein n=1 Tax=Chara braunii TaxID=69332 RepID=A0A388LTS4_CHABU|nr:hypothetical protein CBR_g40340 [Chara braunii]|eukprot:GBG85612.1 hypothetical protein CBR_g40340 [Chara braunii]